MMVVWMMVRMMVRDGDGLAAMMMMMMILMAWRR